MMIGGLGLTAYRSPKEEWPGIYRITSFLLGLTLLMAGDLRSHPQFVLSHRQSSGAIKGKVSAFYKI